jgi:hypothetical protein
MRFDTSGLPDNATIVSASLRLYVTAKSNHDNRNLVGDWYSSIHWPIDSADYSPTVSGTALPGTSIDQLAVGSVKDLPLSGVATISKTGFSALRLGISGGQPPGDNYVQMASFEHTTLPEAQLIVTFS